MRSYCFPVWEAILLISLNKFFSCRLEIASVVKEIWNQLSYHFVNHKCILSKKLLKSEEIIFLAKTFWIPPKSSQVEKPATNLTTADLRSHSSWKNAWIEIACSAKILIIVALFREKSTLAFIWSQSHQAFGFWDISVRWVIAMLFVRHFVKSKIPKSVIWNSCYNGTTAKKFSVTKIFLEFFQPSVRKCVSFSGFFSSISEYAPFSSFSSYSYFSSLSEHPVILTRVCFPNLVYRHQKEELHLQWSPFY